MMRTNAGVLGFMIVMTLSFVAIIAGLFSAMLPWWLALLLFAPPLIIWVGGKWPLLGLVVALLAGYGFFPIGLLMSDMTVIGFVVFMLVMQRRYVASSLSAYTKVWWPLAALLLWGLWSVVYGYFYRGNYLNYVYHDSISVAYWLLMIPILLIAKNEEKAKGALYALIAVSILLSCVALAQSIFNLRLNFSGLGKVGALTNEEGGIAGLARSSIPGILLLIFTFVVAFLRLATPNSSHKLFWTFLLVMSMAGIFVTFGRTSWSVTVFCAFVAAWMSGRVVFTRFMLTGSVVLVIMLLVFSILMPDLMVGIAKRFLSIGDEFGAKGSSLRWRLLENEFARMAILNNPVMGIGLGGEYKPRLVDMRVFGSQTFYIHNGYFYVLMKMGLVGFVLYSAHYFNMLKHSWTKRQEPGLVGDCQKAMFSLFVGTMILSYAQPEFMQGPSIASLASISAITIALGHWSSLSRANQQKAA